MPVRPEKRNVLIDRDPLRPFFGARSVHRGSTSLTDKLAADVADIRNASYVTVNAEAFLNAERRLVAGTGIASVDGGVNSTLTLNVGEGPGIDITADAVGLGGDTILLFDNGGNPVAEHAATNAGFAAAIAAAGAGDLIQLPLALTLTAAHAIPASVTLRGPCVITASGDYGKLLTVDAASILEMLEINYTTTSSSGDPSSIYGSEGCNLRHIKATTTNSTDATATYGLKFDSIADGVRIHDCYFAAVGSVASAGRYGIYIATPVGADGRLLAITNTIGYAHSNAATPTCYGIYLEGTQRRTVMSGCIGYGYAQWNDGTGYGIWTQNATITGCVGEAGTTNTGYGIYCASGWLLGCHGYATAEGAGTAIGILLGDEGYAYNCRAIVVTTGGTEYGFYCDGTNTYIFGGQGGGDEADVYINSGTANLCGVQYTTTAGAGTLNYLQGDRSAYSVEDYHANDIEDGALIRHLPATLTTGNIVVADGTNWQSVTMSGGATLAADGTITIAGEGGGVVALTQLSSYTRGYIIRGGASDWEALDANDSGFILVGNGTDIISVPFDWDTMAGGASADMVHDHSTDAEGAHIPLTSLTSYARGSIIQGGASDWEAYSANTNGAALIGDGTDIVSTLTPTWQSSHTFAQGLSVSASYGITLADGDWLGIAGNELLTVNAAGNFTFSAAVESVVVEDGTWVGADAACSWVFDSTNGDVTTLDKVGIGTVATVANLELHATAGNNVAFWLTDADVNHPFTAMGFVPEIEADVLGAAINAGGTQGGVQFLGFTDVDLTPFWLYGHIGDATPTNPAVIIGGWKTDGVNDRIALANDEIVLQIHNGALVRTTVLGSGYFGILNAAPAYPLDVTGGNAIAAQFSDARVGNNAAGHALFTSPTGYWTYLGAQANDAVILMKGDGSVTIAALGGLGNDDLYVDNAGKLINDPSDVRFKENIKALDGDDALAAVLALRGCYFDWSEASKEVGDLGTRRQVGLIAQEVEPYVPLAVTDVRGQYKSVSAKKLIPYLVEAIKAQQERIEILEAR